MIPKSPVDIQVYLFDFCWEVPGLFLHFLQKRKEMKEKFISHLLYGTE